MEKTLETLNQGSEQTRVRINCSLSAKGLVQWDITSEFPSVDEAILNLKDAITKTREGIRELGLNEAGAV